LEKKFQLPEEVKSELEWWFKNCRSSNGRAFASPEPDLVIYADASNLGWGAVCNNVGTGGPWTSLEAEWHINCKELTAAAHAVRCFVKGQNITVELRLDNQSAVSYINKGGGTHSAQLSSIATELLFWCEERGIFLTAIHLPGALNRAADEESRRTDRCAEWMLCPFLFREIASLWEVEVDLFAAEWNHQLPKFVAWTPQPTAWNVDAFSFSWSNLKAYLFPPFGLISRCAAKIRRERATVTLISPLWPGQIWFPTLLEMSVDYPRILSPRRNLLISSRGHPHPLFQQGNQVLAAWRISGVDSAAEEFRQQLSNFCSKDTVPIRWRDTNQLGEVGIAGVAHGKRIPAIVI
jgi:hypothetical protein